MTAVTQELLRRGVQFEVIAHAPATSASSEARELGMDEDEMLKTLVVDSGGHHAFVVLPGSRRVGMHKVEDALGDPHAHLSTEAELRRDFPEIELGAFPPMGSVVGVETLVDPRVFDHESVAFAAGSRTESVKIRTADLFRAEPVVMAPLARDQAED